MVLAAASAAAWPLLAVAAAAYGRAPPLQCLAAYLNATLARHAADAQVRVRTPDPPPVEQRGHQAEGAVGEVSLGSNR